MSRQPLPARHYPTRVLTSRTLHVDLNPFTVIFQRTLCSAVGGSEKRGGGGRERICFCSENSLVTRYFSSRAILYPPPHLACKHISSSSSAFPAPSNLHNDRHMIIHILLDIAQKARRNHTQPAKRNADQIHPSVALRERNLPRSYNNLPRRVIARNAGD